MNRLVACLVALAVTSIGASASAQTTVIVQPTPVVVIIEAPSPPPEPPSPPEPPPAAEPPSTSARPRFVLDLGGDFMLGAGYDTTALGGSLRAGAMFDHGMTAELAVGYASAMSGQSEVSLGVEVQRDFSPHDVVGFLLLGRVGTAFLLDDLSPRDSGIRLSGQIGVGARLDLSADLAMLIDARAVVRYRPDDPSGPAQDDLSAG